MGQKTMEIPACDYWVQLAREADKAGAPLGGIRRTSDKKQLAQQADMNRARTRFIVGHGFMQSTHIAYTSCVSCGTTLSDSQRSALWPRGSVWESDGTVTDYYRCKDCGGKSRQPALAVQGDKDAQVFSKSIHGMGGDHLGRHGRVRRH